MSRRGWEAADATDLPYNCDDGGRPHPFGFNRRPSVGWISLVHDRGTAVHDGAYVVLCTRFVCGARRNIPRAASTSRKLDRRLARWPAPAIVAEVVKTSGGVDEVTNPGAELAHTPNTGQAGACGRASQIAQL